MQDRGVTAPREFPKAPGVKIVRAAEASVWRDAYRFLAEAEEAHAAERARGFTEGKAAGSEEAGKLVAETAAKVERYLASMEKEIAQLAFDIVRRVLDEFDDTELVARAARNALADFREAKAVKIRVHPDAEGQVHRILSEMTAAHTPLVTVETDDQLSVRSCILSTEIAVIEATVETQLAAIAKAMGLHPAARAGE